MKLQALESGIWHGSFEDAAGNLRVISLRTGDRATAETIAAALVELSASVTVTVTPSVAKVFQRLVGRENTRGRSGNGRFLSSDFERLFAVPRREGFG